MENNHEILPERCRNRQVTREGKVSGNIQTYLFVKPATFHHCMPAVCCPQFPGADFGTHATVQVYRTKGKAIAKTLAVSRRAVCRELE